MRSGLDSYSEFLKSEQVPVIEGLGVDDLRTLKLSPSKRRGGLGAYIKLGYQQLSDVYVAEISGKSSMKTERHLFEETVFVISGKGHSVIKYKGKSFRTNWKTGSQFIIPLNSLHQHINDSKEPSRLLFYSNAPAVIDTLGDIEFVFNCNTIPKNRKRFLPLSDKMKLIGRSITHAPAYKMSKINDIRKLQQMLEKQSTGFRGFQRIELVMPTTLECHISLLSVGSYGKAHRHGPGAFIYILAGRGYSLLWEEGKPKHKVRWHEGSMLSPLGGWYHQHFNTGKVPVIQLALRNNTSFGVLGGDPKSGKPVQIERENEEKTIRKEFERAIGARVR